MSFQRIILIIAVVLLIITLIMAAIALNNKKEDDKFHLFNHNVLIIGMLKEKMEIQYVLIVKD